MSGLAAAYSLTKAGIKVNVIEARDRIGGRLHTDDSLGFPMDLGASWIHGIKGNPLTKLANQQGMARVVTESDFVRRGEKDPKTSWWKDKKEYLNLLAQGDGVDLDQINVTSYAIGTSPVYPGPEVIFPGGYAPILEPLRGDYTVTLSTFISKIILEESAVKTVTRDGQQEQTWDAVLVTVPLGVLKAGSIEFEPPLPKAKADAIAGLQMCTLDKLYLKFDERFWDRDYFNILGRNDLPEGQFKIFVNFHRAFGYPVIMIFHGGSAALEVAKMSDEEVIDKAMYGLAMAYPSDVDTEHEPIV